jgi:hypothetical protein
MRNYNCFSSGLVESQTCSSTLQGAVNTIRLLDLLKQEAVQRGLVSPAAEIDAPVAYALVRDMPYRRASQRLPETIIREWRGTCSGKHYLLQALFAELGLPSQVIACTTVVPIDRVDVPDHLLSLYESANRRFVDVHNYLLVALPSGGKMVVDATWPLSAAKAGLTVNPRFVLGQDQQIAAVPLQRWPIPPGRDPQDFKDELLRAHFTAEELLFREEVIRALGDRTAL